MRRWLARYAALLALLVLAPFASPAAPAAAANTGFRLVEIVARDGVVLKANVIAPRTAGPHPAIVFVNSWGLNDAEYLAQATRFADAGYVVLSYTTRGFWFSGGRIDTGGPLDIADASTAIDWLLANTSADPGKIGMAGISYGSGISLMTAGADPRVRAVAAMSAWTDLPRSLYADQTRHGQAAGLLDGLALLTGRPSTELRTTLDDFFANRNIDQVMAFGRVRSAQTHLAAINRNAPAIMIANAYGDSLFAPNQLVDFYGQLTGPKRLELAPGDHATVEGLGLVGLPNPVWRNVRRWFDAYLAGTDTSITTERPVVLDPRGSAGPESYTSWADVTGSTQRYRLGAERLDGTGPLSPSAAAGWSDTIYAGVDTVAWGGIAIVTNGLEGLTGIPPKAWLPGVNRLHGAVWTSGTFGAKRAVRGIPRLHLSFAPASRAGTLVAYLYDLDALGTGRLVTHAPTSWVGATPNVRRAVDLDFPAAAYDIPAGHRLALVVDTEDLLYLDSNPLGSPLRLSSPTADPTWLELPLR